MARKAAASLTRAFGRYDKAIVAQLAEVSVNGRFPVAASPFVPSFSANKPASDPLP
jgi:hypothetical protein